MARRASETTLIDQTDNGADGRDEGGTDEQAVHHPGWRILKNTFALGAGSNLVALGRLVVLALIVRYCGVAVFAKYVILIEVLKIAEGILDFGTTDTFVRESNRSRSRFSQLLRILTAFKMVQIPAAMVTLMVIILVMRYPEEIVHAGLLAAASLICYAVVLIYRVIFRANLTMEREILAESLSVVAMIALVLSVAREDIPLIVLFACYLLSRSLYAGLCVVFGRRQFLLRIHGVSLPDMRWAMRCSAVIGIVGFVVIVYRATDLLLLSVLVDNGSESTDVAFFSAAQKLSWPILIGLGAIGSTLYSVAAGYWPHARDALQRACQRGIDVTFLLGGIPVCVLIAGDRFFMGLLGPELADGAPALQVLAVLCLLKAISLTLGPILFVVHAQRWALWCVGVALIIKVALIVALAPAYGYLGVALIGLVVELTIVIIPTVYLVQKYAGIRVRWGIPVRVAVVVIAAVLFSQWIDPDGGWRAAGAALLIYVPVILAIAAPLSEIRSILSSRSSS